MSLGSVVAPPFCAPVWTGPIARAAHKRTLVCLTAGGVPAPAPAPQPPAQEVQAQEPELGGQQPAPVAQQLPVNAEENMQRFLDQFLVDTDQQGPVLREWLSAACAPSHDVVRRLVDACARAVDFGESEDDRKNIGAAWRAGRRELLQRVRADEQSMSRLHRWVLNLARCPGRQRARNGWNPKQGLGFAFVAS